MITADVKIVFGSWRATAPPEADADLLRQRPDGGGCCVAS